MNPFRYRSIVEADHHIQNPLSPAKLARVVDYLRLADGDRVIDVGSGKGSLLLTMAERHRIEAVGLELNPAFADAARDKLAASELAGAVTVIEGPALDYEVAPGSFDMAVTIGATFALGGFEQSLDWLAAAVPSGGRIAVGEPFAKRRFSPEARARWTEYDRTLLDIEAAIRSRDLTLTGIVASAAEDWDHYESQHWRAAAAWLREHPDDPDAAWLTEKMDADRRDYLTEEREAFGWAVFIAQKR
jgi:cyclopropane fatty-acyl-phospholipid synthase-like methyltransferase